MRYLNSTLLGSVLLLAALRADAADFAVVNSGATDYVIDGVNDPTLTLVRGQTYTFAINASGHPFWIKTTATTGIGNSYSTGVTNNGTDNGILTFAVPYEAPDTLVYICQYHFSMRGTLLITNPPPTDARLSNPRTGGNGVFRFDVEGTPFRLHSIEASTRPDGGWSIIGFTNVPASGVFTFTDANAPAGVPRFYRVETQ